MPPLASGGPDLQHDLKPTPDLGNGLLHCKPSVVEPDPGLLKLLQQPPPGNNAVKHEGLDVVVVKKIISARTKISEAITLIEKDLNILKIETAFLSRLLYKQRNQFRNDHGYKYFQSLRKSVDKCCENYPGTILSNFLSLLPQILQSSPHLPPVSLCEHAALRTWLYLSSLDRVLHLCQLTALQAMKRFHLGHIWEAAAVRLAVTSRIWALASHTKKHVLVVLCKLQVLSTSLPSGSSIYSKEDLKKIFASCTQENENLNDSGVKSVNNMDYGVKIKRAKADVLIDAKKTKSVEDWNKEISSSKIQEKIKLDEEVEETKTLRKSEAILENIKSNKKIKKKVKLQVNETKMKKMAENPVKKFQDPEHVDFSYLSELHTLDDLKHFLEEETRQRKRCRKEARTRRLNQDEWKSLKMEVMSGFKPNLPNKSIKLSRKLIKKALLDKPSK